MGIMDVKLGQIWEASPWKALGQTDHCRVHLGSLGHCGLPAGHEGAHANEALAPLESLQKAIDSALRKVGETMVREDEERWNSTVPLTPPAAFMRLEVGPKPPAKAHRFDRYCVAPQDMGEKPVTRKGDELCVDCGRDYAAASPCVPVPGWRELMERQLTTKTLCDDAAKLPRPVCYRCEWALADCLCTEGPLLVKPTPRYDARQLLAPVGLGPGELVCPVRPVRGPR